jgi:SAM-dependent methyltransferase
MRNQKIKYKKLDKIYFEYLSQRSFLGKIYRSFILYPRLNKHLKGKVLDIGCGIGDMLSFRPNTIGLDINPLNVNYCKKKKLEAYLMKNGCIPFEDQSFDSLLLDNVLEHIDTPTLLFKEIKRVLKPDGILLIGVPGISGFESDTDHKKFYDEIRLKSLAKKFKFSVSYFFYTPFFRSIFLSKILKQYCIYTQWKK